MYDLNMCLPSHTRVLSSCTRVCSAPGCFLFALEQNQAEAMYGSNMGYPPTPECCLLASWVCASLLSFCTRGKRGTVWLKTWVTLLLCCILASWVCASLLSFCTKTGAREAMCDLQAGCVLSSYSCIGDETNGRIRRLLKFQCWITLILPNCICAESKHMQKQNAIECHCVESMALRPRKSESPLLKRSGKAALEAFTRKRPHA